MFNKGQPFSFAMEMLLLGCKFWRSEANEDQFQEKCRYTSERSNISLCPLQILRGFGALHLLASGKTEKAISDIITQGTALDECLNTAILSANS